MRVRLRGDFLSRERVQWTRVVVCVLWRCRDYVSAAVSSEWENVRQRDRERTCPHPCQHREHYGEDVRCRWCGAWLT